MGFKVEVRKATITCDCCGKRVETTTYSNNYEFKQVICGDCYQDGKGTYQDFGVRNTKVMYMCNACYNKYIFKNLRKEEK